MNPILQSILLVYLAMIASTYHYMRKYIIMIIVSVAVYFYVSEPVM